MATFSVEDKLRFLLQVLEATDAQPDLQKVAITRGDKKANIAYQFKAIVKASGEYVLTNGRVTIPDQSDTPTPQKSAANPAKARSTEGKKARTPEASDDQIATPANTPDNVGSDKDVNEIKQASPSKTPKSPASTKKRGRPASKHKDSLQSPVKKPRQSKKQKDAAAAAEEAKGEDDNDGEVVEDELNEKIESETDVKNDEEKTVSADEDDD